MVTWIKQVPAGDAGTSSKVGGNNWNTNDKYHGNVDVSAELTNPTQIATPTTYNNAILKIGNASNSNTVTITSAAQTGSYQLNIPALSANTDLPIGTSGAATLSAANTFTAIQTISSDNQRILKLYRPANTANNICGIEVDHRNSSNTQTEFARWVGKLITNTAGAEVGAIEEYVNKAGTVTKVRTTDQNGMMTIGSGQNLAVPGYVKNSGTTTTTTSSITEFDLLNYSVPANLLGANGGLRVRISGAILQNQATATDFRWRIKFGGTTIMDGSRTALGQNAVAKPFVLDFTIGNQNATNSQRATGLLMMNDSDTTSLTTGEGSFDDDEIHVSSPFRSTDPAKDTTSAQTLAVTMTHSVNSSSVSTTVHRQIIEFIPGI